MQQLIPKGPRVLVHAPVAKERKTPGGILIPGNATDPPQEGFVTAVGDGFRLNTGELVPSDYQVGDFVLFAKYAGQEIHRDGERYMMLNETEILGVLREVPDPEPEKEVQTITAAEVGSVESVLTP